LIANAITRVSASCTNLKLWKDEAAKFITYVPDGFIGNLIEILRILHGARDLEAHIS
jgi:plasmid stabilization system protein ParE